MPIDEYAFVVDNRSQLYNTFDYMHKSIKFI